MPTFFLSLNRRQRNDGFGGDVLPLVVTDSALQGSRSDVAEFSLGSQTVPKRARAPSRSFLPETSGPPEHFLAPTDVGWGTERNKVFGRREMCGEERAVRGLREDDGEIGCWVGEEEDKEEERAGSYPLRDSGCKLLSDTVLATRPSRGSDSVRTWNGSYIAGV